MIDSKHNNWWASDELLVQMCEIDMLVQGMFGFFGLLTSYIIYKAVKKRDEEKQMKKLELTLEKVSKDLKI